MKLTIIGCGDAFSSGGRLQSAFLLDSGPSRLLIDCGATILVGLEHMRLNPNSIPRIVISHLHGDHFAGLVWFLMHAAFVANRVAPLDIYGPPGVEARVHAAIEIMYPGVPALIGGFEVRYHEIQSRQPIDVGGVQVTAFEVVHPSGAPSYALRFEQGGKVFAYTGDSQWTDALIAAGLQADLYLMECYKFNGTPILHLSWTMIERHLDQIGARRIVLTHMAQDMLDRRGEIHDQRVTFAEDGAVVDI